MPEVSFSLFLLSFDLPSFLKISRIGSLLITVPKVIFWRETPNQEAVFIRNGGWLYQILQLEPVQDH